MDSKKYFDKYLPNYSLDNYPAIINELKKNKVAKIVDIGSGDASGINLIYKKFHNRIDVFGIEEASVYSKVIPKLFKGKIFYCSILDTNIIKKIMHRFDAVVLSRVLHHLVEKSPSSSIRLSQNAINNCQHLLKRGGIIVISEPLFEPLFLNKTLFFIKRFVGLIFKKRVSFFGYWNNIGAPLVNYFSRKNIQDLFMGMEVLKFECKQSRTSFFTNIFFKKYEALIVLKKND